MRRGPFLRIILEFVFYSITHPFSKRSDKIWKKICHTFDTSSIFVRIFHVSAVIYAFIIAAVIVVTVVPAAIVEVLQRQLLFVLQVFLLWQF